LAETAFCGLASRRLQFIIWSSDFIRSFGFRYSPLTRVAGKARAKAYGGNGDEKSGPPVQLLFSLPPSGGLHLGAAPRTM